MNNGCGSFVESSIRPQVLSINFLKQFFQATAPGNRLQIYCANTGDGNA